MKYLITNYSFIAAIFFAISLRSIISLHNYSGYKKPPMFGDFEAQRHWQEITINLPVKNWYKNSSNNDLLYWGLDYPPLTAYHSFVMGKIAKNINEDFVELNSSRGITTLEHKNYMRFTVLLSDIFIYLPGIILIVRYMKRNINGKNEVSNNNSLLLAFLVFVCYPGQILIDNGHFQYNNMSLGLTVFAVYFILIDKNILGSLFYSLALNYKQMELYHSLPFFIYLLRTCFPSFRDVFRSNNISNFIKIALTVVSCFILLWLPWLTSLDDFKSVLVRLFPFNRGVFEDKVSNFWCIFNIIVKIKEHFTTERMVIICLVSTLISILPSSINLFIRPFKKNFLYALINSSLGFFLFSYQVHEKSILIAALPVLILFNDSDLINFWFLQITTFSMLPLLHKDGLSVAYISTTIITELIYNSLKETKDNNNLTIILKHISMFGASLLTILYFFGPIPKNLPHIYEILISGYSCVHFIAFFIYCNIKQIFYLSN